MRIIGMSCQAALFAMTMRSPARRLDRRCWMKGGGLELPSWAWQTSESRQRFDVRKWRMQVDEKMHLTSTSCNLQRDNRDDGQVGWR